MVTSTGTAAVVKALVKKVRAAARSRLVDSQTSMTCPNWSIARYRYVHRPLTLTYVSSTNQRSGLLHVPKPYPQEFRNDVVNVARRSNPGQTLKQIAADFGVSESWLTGWIKAADVDEGAKPGLIADQATELREVKRRNRLLEQENEVLRRAAAYLFQANLPGK